jgi:carotenoid cleavage dioxygenase
VPNTLRRITLDLGSRNGAVEEETLIETPMSSFTRIDERFITLPYRYVFVQYADSRFDSGDVLGRTDGNCIGRFDVHTGTVKPFFPGPGRAVHEPVFIPRTATSPEGDGYLLAVANNVVQSTTELYLIEATSMEEMARITLPFRSSPQVHGTWANADTLPLQ